MLVKHLLIILSAVTLAIADSQVCGAPGGCSCNCDCNADPTGPIQPPLVTCTPCGNGSLGNCEQQILAASVKYPSLGQLLGALLNTLLINLIIPILQIVLAGNNTLTGAVLPLASVLCYLVGLLLLILQKLGLLGLLGQNGLLSNIFAGIAEGGIGGIGGLGR